MTDGLTALIDSTPYFVFLGLHDAPEAGDNTVVLRADARHIGDISRRSVHGGVLASFLESAALLQLRREGVPTAKTIDFTSDFLREARVADTFATVTVVREGRRFANVRVEVWQDDPATIVAIGHGNFLLVR